MKNRYLYKAKKINTDTWVESMTIGTGKIKRKRNDLFMEIGKEACPERWVGIDKDTLCQCTGRKDSKGKLIFEGDIASGVNGSVNGEPWKWGPFEIKWIEEESTFDVPNWGTLENQNSTHWFEITGNIHD